MICTVFCINITDAVIFVYINTKGKFKQGREVYDMKNKYRGVCCILASGAFFSMMTAFVRLSGDIPSIEKAFFRNLVAAFIMFFVLLKSEEKFHIKKGNVKYLLARSITGCLGIICNFYAIDHLMLSDANMLNKLSPFFAIIFSYFLLKEKLSIIQVMGVILAFFGSLLIIKPSGNPGEFFPSLMGVLGGAGAGIAYTIVRMLGNRNERGQIIVFFFSAFSCLFILPFLIIFYKPLSPVQLLTLIGAGCCAYGGQVFITRAYTFAPAREISVYDYAQVIFSSVLGFFFFGQVPDHFSVLGYFVIIGMAVAMFIYNNGNDKKIPDKTAIKVNSGKF